MKRYCLSVDLKDDARLIAEYEQYHQAVWPEVLASIKEAGIIHMEIYRLSTRLFMIMDVNDSFSFERKAAMDLVNEKVQDWETLMWKYQQPLPTASKGEKWILMNKIFSVTA